MPALLKELSVALVIRVAVLSGPNLDRLGTREPAIYGHHHARPRSTARSRRRRAPRGAEAVCRQSNHEGNLVRSIGAAGDDGFAGVVLNAAAYTHTSIAILDAIKAGGVPVDRGPPLQPRRAGAVPPPLGHRAAPASGRVAGFGPRSYVLGLEGLLHHLERP